VADAGISQAVQAFVADHIESVLQLEVLLLLRGRPGTDFVAHDIADELKIDRAWVAGQLENLRSRGLLASDDVPAASGGGGAAAVPRRYRYAPRTSELAGVLDELARAYADRRVTVISLIFSKPAASGIRTFADAFRFRKDKDKPDG
jgi:predicted transcriptional regulator